jgi:hypothetical protein
MGCYGVWVELLIILKEDQLYWASPLWGLLMYSCSGMDCWCEKHMLISFSVDLYGGTIGFWSGW